MPQVTLTLTDTPNGAVSVHSSFRPAAGLPLSPSQAHALDIIARTHKLWGIHIDAAPGGVDIDAVHRTRGQVLPPADVVTKLKDMPPMQERGR